MYDTSSWHKRRLIYFLKVCNGSNHYIKTDTLERKSKIRTNSLTKRPILKNGRWLVVSHIPLYSVRTRGKTYVVHFLKKKTKKSPSTKFYSGSSNKYPSGQDEPNLPTRISRVCTVRKTSLAHRQILTRHPNVKWYTFSSPSPLIARFCCKKKTKKISRSRFTLEKNLSSTCGQVYFKWLRESARIGKDWIQFPVLNSPPWWLCLWFLHLSALRHHCRHFVNLLNRRNKSFYWLSLFNEMTRYCPC